VSALARNFAITSLVVAQRDEHISVYHSKIFYLAENTNVFFHTRLAFHHLLIIGSYCAVQAEEKALLHLLSMI